MGIFTAMQAEKRSTLENPSTSLADYFTQGAKTRSGVAVTNATALNLSAVWAAIRLLSDAVALLPLVTYERQDIGKSRADGHRNYELLKLRPNPYMTAFSFWEAMAGHLASWGNAYAEKELDGAGRTIALWPLLPDRTTVEWLGGQKVYTTRVKGREFTMASDKVLHIPGFGFDGLIGYNPIHIARMSLGLTQAAEDFGASFFGSGAQLSGVLTHPARLGAEAQKQLSKDWQRMHSGLDNAHRVAVLEEGMKFEATSIPPEDAQFLQTRKFQTTEVARWFKVPPHMIGDLERSTNNNIEQQSLEFLRYTLMPWLRRIEEVVNWDLFTPAERKRYFAEFNAEALLRGDSAARAAYHKELWMIGATSINEVRAIENMNAVDGGDRRFVPMNMVPLEQAGLPAPDEPTPVPPEEDAPRAIEAPKEERSVSMRGRLAERHMRLFRETAQAVLNRELIAARRALKSSFGARDSAKFRTWLDEYYEKHPEEVTKRFLALLLAYASAVSAEVEDEVGQTPEIQRAVEDYAAGFGRRWSNSSATQLKALMRDTPAEELEAVLTERLDEWEEKRADKVAREESYASGNAFSVASYVALGVVSMRWVTVGENCPLCNKMNGRTIATGGHFLSEGDTVDPGVEGTAPFKVSRAVSYPPLHNGCNCFVSASL